MLHPKSQWQFCSGALVPLKKKTYSTSIDGHSKSTPAQVLATSPSWRLNHKYQGGPLLQASGLSLGRQLQMMGDSGEGDALLMDTLPQTQKKQQSFKSWTCLAQLHFWWCIYWQWWQSWVRAGLQRSHLGKCEEWAKSKASELRIISGIVKGPFLSLLLACLWTWTSNKFLGSQWHWWT